METIDRSKLDQAIEALGLTYNAQFVPWSQSRNAKAKPKLSDYCLNWRLSVAKNGVALNTDYSAGIGHIPGHKYESRPSVDYANGIARTCESGRYGSFAGRPIPAPTLADVLYSLVSDSSAIDSTFEDWAGDYGYDTDSRKAEETYRACVEIGLKLRRMIGNKKLEELRELFQDY